MNEDTKSMFLSKTLWGIVIAFVAQILARKGFTVDVAAWTNDIVSLAGLLLSVYGRVTATKDLTVSGK